MNLSTIHQMHDRRPFIPFTICLADGGKLPVPHPEFFSIGPDELIAIVHKIGGGFVILDTPLIIGIEVNGAQSKPKRRSQKK